MTFVKLSTLANKIVDDVKKKRVVISDPVAHFWSRIKVGEPNECWPWQGSKIIYGYGILKMAAFENIGRPTQRAHRVAYFIATGVDPGELHVMHSCDNRACCNPHHLSLGTNADNTADKMRKGRHPKQINPTTHCKRGHEFTGKNIYVGAHGRQCMRCIVERSRMTRARQKAEKDRTRRLLAGAESDALKCKEPT